jgi:hypothetical protein
MSIVAIIFDTNYDDMIDFGHILFSSGVIQGLLLILPKELMPEENFEEWLNNDGFKYNPEQYGDKKFLFTELEKLKKDFRQLINKDESIVDANGKNVPAITIFNWIQLKKIQIEKVRLMINHEISFGTNLHTPTGVRYVVFRAYWINNEGKKFRKFAKNIGAEDKVLLNGKVPTHKLNEVEMEIDRMMWEQYKSEYKVETP